MSREVGGSREREDMKRWVRGEFDKWKGTTDEVGKNCSRVSKTSFWLVDMIHTDNTSTLSFLFVHNFNCGTMHKWNNILPNKCIIESVDSIIM